MPENNNHTLEEPRTLEEIRPEDDIRSEEVQEIMGRMPSWIVRRGIAMVAILLLCLFVGSYFFKYPDIIPARVTISAANPPVKLVARSSLPIQNIFVKDNEMVKEDQLLCILANAANYDEMLKVVPLVQQIDTALDLAALSLAVDLPAGLHLGDLQSVYAELIQALQDYRFYLKHNVYGATVDNLQKQVTYNNQLNRELSTKDRMLKEQLELQHRRFSADSDLVKNKVISRVEYEQSRKQMLDQQMNTEGNKSNIIQNSLQQAQYEKNITDIRQQQRSEENNLQQKLKDVATRFLGQYAQWEQSYILRSPTAGKVTFFRYWKENQFVQAGEGVMMVVPPAQEYVVRGDIGIDRSGKIEAGQKVLIKLTAYPFEEYGMLRGIVVSRSAVAMDSTFVLEIKLENGLKTNAGKAIPAQPQLFGLGEIMTEDKSVLQRLFEKVYGKWRR
ncbi:HlyD family secretion protein [Taibaiella koreensis]|uniref:HlyD family secretion protein n=1 Tax=Taibaiella koreensis TaxID=1268548 RepID=UPI000E59B48C|nr:HlyD family efflux transporter periplasmic adaptor subunit [Taibaiella koreensis]